MNNRDSFYKDFIPIGIVFVLIVVIKLLIELYRLVWRYAEEIYDLLTPYGLILLTLILIIYLRKDAVALYEQWKYSRTIYGKIDRQRAIALRFRNWVNDCVRRLSDRVYNFKKKVYSIPADRRKFHRKMEPITTYLDQLLKVYRSVEEVLDALESDLKYASIQISIMEETNELTLEIEQELQLDLHNFQSYALQFKDQIREDIHLELESPNSVVGQLHGYPQINEFVEAPVQIVPVELPEASSDIIEEMFGNTIDKLDELNMHIKTLETMRCLL